MLGFTKKRESAQTFTILAGWDPEASVWVATSEDIPGLIVEADTVEALAEELRLVIPDLLELNGISGSEQDDRSVPINLLAEYQIG